MIEMVNGSLMRVEPSGAWNQCWERGAEGESLGRSGIRPYRAWGDIVASGQGRVGKRVYPAEGGLKEAQRREEAVRKRGNLPDRGWFFPDSNRLFPDKRSSFPALPASSRLFPHKFFSKRSLYPIWGNGAVWDAEGWNIEERRDGARNYAEKIWLPKPATSQIPQVGCSLARNVVGFLRIFPRFSAILRTDQGRIYAILRIFTGETNF